MKIYSFFNLTAASFLGLTLFQFQLFAKDDLPPPRIVQSPLQTVGDAIHLVHFSFPFKSSSPHVITTPDLIQLSADRMKEFIDGKGRFEKWAKVPSSRKGVIIKHYQIGDERILESKKYMMGKGIGRITFISDSNMYFEGKYKEGETFNSRFDEATPLLSPGGVYMQKLLHQLKFTYNGDSRFTVYLQPLFSKDKNTITDIMHEKQIMYAVYKDNTCTEVEDILWEEGSNNLTDNPRVNMRIEHNDPIGARYAYDRAMAMANVFKEGQPINKTPYDAPLRIVYGDGSFQEIAMTDGQWNPNIRIARVLYRSAGLDQNGDALLPDDKGPKVEVDWTGWKHFVITYFRGLGAHKASMKANKKQTGNVIADGQFLYTLGFGLGPTIAGFPVVAPYGRVFYPYPRELRSRLTTHAFQMRAPGRMDEDPDGPPIGKTVMHLKTTEMRIRVDGLPWTMIFTGSLNLSNHEENAETQIQWMFPAGSPIAESMIQATEQIPQAYPQAEVDFPRAILREILEHILGRNIFEIPLPWLDQQLSLLIQENFKQIGENLTALAHQKSEVKLRPAIELVEHRIARMIQFTQWYIAQPYAYKMDVVKMSLVFMIILKSEDVPFPFKMIEELLESILWNKDEAETAKRISDAWNTMGFPARTALKPVTQKVVVPNAKEIPPSMSERKAQLRSAIDSLQLRVSPMACGINLKAL